MQNYKIITYNIFVGSPLENYFRNGTKSVLIENRAKDQIMEIKAINPDIICFQEMYSISIVNLYKKNLSEYDAYYDYKFCTFGKLLYSSCNVVIFIPLILILKYIFAIESIYIYFAAFLLMTIFIHIMLLNKVIYLFLYGDIKTANVIFYKHYLQIDHKSSYVKEFDNQDGDILNIFRKRGFIAMNIQIGNSILSIINCHLSNRQTLCEKDKCLESSINRHLQIEEMIEDINTNHKVILCGDLNSYSNSIEINLLKDRFNTVMEIDTWSNNNNLTKGFIMLEDHQSDYIFTYNINIISSRLIMKDEYIQLSDHYGIETIISI